MRKHLVLNAAESPSTSLQKPRRRRSPRMLLAALLALGALGGMAESPQAFAQQGATGLYWQCVAPSSSNPNGGYCPAGTTYPLPVQGAGGSLLTGGLEFNASVAPTVQNASYAAGQSLGGLQTIAVGTTAGISGILTQLSAESKGGSTVGMVLYLWAKNPTGTTCSDKSNFVASLADNQFLVIPPTLLTPTTVVSAQDTMTYAAAQNLVGNFVNGSGNGNLYMCVLANASVVPATTSDLRFNIQGIKDQP